MNYTFAPNSNSSLIAVDPGLGGSYKNITRFKCAEEVDWVTGADGTKRKTVTVAGSTFSLEDKGGDITVKGEWKNFAKCPKCKETAEAALQSALTKARAKNSGKLTEQTTVVEGKTMTYGPAGDVVYADMKLGDILTNLAETYNSLLEKARVPVEAWEPGKQFYVRDETAVISGAIDQGLEELKDIPDLVGLGLTLVSDPEGAAKQLEAFRQQMSWDKAEKLGADLAKDVTQYDNFSKGGKYALYGTGRIGVMIVITVTTGGILEAIKEAPNQLRKNLDDIASLLDKAGKFVDAVLEADYQKYLARKASLGKSARERLDWKQIRDYWLNDSPMARGNAFNKKALQEKWYDYNEVNLSNGKRLDGYDPIKGEIISRKATNLEDIELSTFESYLAEMKSKYAAGTAINSPKYSPYLDGQVLQGKQILEIPIDNQSFSKIQDYLDLAKNKYNIEIRFRPE